MKVVIWGCRGSLPVSNNYHHTRKKVRAALEAALAKGLRPGADIDAFIDNELPVSVWGSYGSNTCCVQFDTGHDEYIVMDCGSGLRDLGNHVMATRGPKPAVFNIFMTHLHWDHLMGFPFFVPAYIPGNRINFFGVHDQVEQALRTQQSQPYFPVDFDLLGADITFTTIEPDTPIQVAGAEVMAREQDHPGRSYGYKVTQDGKTAILSTDCEHRADAQDDDYHFIEFFRDADLLIFDAQYTFEAANTAKEDWGHSSNVIGVELAKRSGVKTLCLFHQEPTLEDDDLEKFLDDTRRYAALFHDDTPLDVIMAFDRMEYEL